MNDIEKERQLFTKYPPHIVQLVKMAAEAIKEGRAEIKDGVLVFKEALPEDKNK